MENFNFFVEMPDSDEWIEKSKGKARESGKYDNMIIEGVASDATEDADGEVLDPNGFEIDRFLRDGLINYEHLAKEGGAKYIVGEPLDAKIENGKFRIRAKLYKGHKIAEDLWDTLHIMKANGSKRRLGWSIEGKTLEKQGKRITKALLTHCAVTFMPKNYNTFADIAKGHQKEDFVKPEFDKETFLYKAEKDGYIITVDKNLKVNVKKAIDTVSAAPLTKESLEKKPLNLKDFTVIKKALDSGLITKQIFADLIRKNLLKNFSK